MYLFIIRAKAIINSEGTEQRRGASIVTDQEMGKIVKRLWLLPDCVLLLKMAGKLLDLNI